MFCKFCGASIDSDSVFCKECGKKLQTQTNPIQPNETVQSVEATPSESKSTMLSMKRICPKCGMSNPPSYYSCANCHTCITKADTTQTVSPTIEQTIFETESGQIGPDIDTVVINRNTNKQRLCSVCGEVLREDLVNSNICDCCYIKKYAGSSPLMAKHFINKKLIFLLITIILIIIFVVKVLRDVETESYSHETTSSSQQNISSTSNNDDYITYSEYQKIENGMCYDEVCEITGSYGTELSCVNLGGYETVIIMWKGKGAMGANANVTFQNGKVNAKAQFGLE